MGSRLANVGLFLSFLVIVGSAVAWSENPTVASVVLFAGAVAAVQMKITVSVLECLLWLVDSHLSDSPVEAPPEPAQKPLPRIKYSPR